MRDLMVVSILVLFVGLALIVGIFADSDIRAQDRERRGKNHEARPFDQG